LHGKLETQKLLPLGKGPMNMAFHPDGRALLIANHDAGSLAVIDLERAEVGDEDLGVASRRA
jgi:DNA-binding beta-propeller fold protein YncE